MGWSGQEGSAWIGRGGGPSSVTTSLGDASGGSEASELLIVCFTEYYKNVWVRKDRTVEERNMIRDLK